MGNGSILVAESIKLMFHSFLTLFSCKRKRTKFMCQKVLISNNFFSCSAVCSRKFPLKLIPALQMTLSYCGKLRTNFSLIWDMSSSKYWVFLSSCLSFWEISRISTSYHFFKNCCTISRPSHEHPPVMIAFFIFFWEWEINYAKELQCFKRATSQKKDKSFSVFFLYFQWLKVELFE